jgi:chemotaxis protein CheZ
MLCLRHEAEADGGPGGPYSTGGCRDDPRRNGRPSHLRRSAYGQLSEIRKQIAGVIAAPTAATRNSGLELEAVVQATEEAANRIMEAAEAIGDWLRGGHNDADGLAAVNEKVNAIFEACSFQDVTGQRIRRAIQHLQQVETMLTDMAPDEHGAPSEPRLVVHAPYNGAGAISVEESAANPDLAQDAVDSLFD